MVCRVRQPVKPADISQTCDQLLLMDNILPKQDWTRFWPRIWYFSCFVANCKLSNYHIVWYKSSPPSTHPTFQKNTEKRIARSEPQRGLRPCSHFFWDSFPFSSKFYSFFAMPLLGSKSIVRRKGNIDYCLVVQLQDWTIRSLGQPINVSVYVGLGWGWGELWLITAQFFITSFCIFQKTVKICNNAPVLFCTFEHMVWLRFSQAFLFTQPGQARN